MNVNRYAVIHEKFPREMLLLQGKGCRWKQCTFCDYHEDKNNAPYTLNRTEILKLTGKYQTVDVINSGSVFELDGDTLSLLESVLYEKQVKTLWFECHWLYRHRLEELRQRFQGITVKFRTGVETFNPKLRTDWKKGIPESVTAPDIARYFQGVCLLVCIKGQDKETILNDLALADRYFEYYSVNVFTPNTTSIECDNQLKEWFLSDVAPSLQKNPKAELLIRNTDLGVG